MKHLKRLLPLFLAALTLLSSCTDKGGNTDETSDTLSSTGTTDNGTVTPEKENGVFLNVDINTVTFPFFGELIKQETITEDDVNKFVDQYADTQITDIAYNIFCQFSATPTDVMTSATAQYNRTEIAGASVNFKDNLKEINGVYEKYGDPYETWFKRTWEKGMTPWISVRMNDCHEPNNLYSWIHGDLFHTARENGWMIGGGSYYRYCLDYAVPNVREIMLDYIEEQLLRYDVGGIELDFSREWNCFKNSSEENTEIMTQFMRDVNDIVKEAEKKWGHDVKVTVRLMRDIEQNLKLGFDAAAYASEKLVDSITVTPRWSSNDSDMPISEWKKAFPDIEIYAGITDLTLGTGPTTYQIVAGYSAQYLSQGADKIYLFDFFNNPFNIDEGNAKMYKTCGSLKTLAEEGKRYLVTYQDYTASGYKAWEPLPAEANGFEFSFKTGEIDEGDELWLVVGLNVEIKKRETLKLYVNGVEATLKSSTSYGRPFNTANYTYRYTIPKGSCSNGDVQEIKFVNEDGTVIVAYMELLAGVKMG